MNDKDETPRSMICLLFLVGVWRSGGRNPWTHGKIKNRHEKYNRVCEKPMSGVWCWVSCLCLSDPLLLSSDSGAHAVHSNKPKKPTRPRPFVGAFSLHGFVLISVCWPAVETFPWSITQPLVGLSPVVGHAEKKTKLYPVPSPKEIKDGASHLFVLYILALSLSHCASHSTYPSLKDLGSRQQLFPRS